MEKHNKKQVSCYIDAELWKKLRKKAIDSELSTSVMLERLIKEFLER